MAQSYAENYSSKDQKATAGEYASQAKDFAEDAKQEARTLVDRVVSYAKANPLEAIAIAAGAAFVAGGIILGPRLFKGPSRGEQFERLLSDAYRQAERARDDSTTWNRLSEWVRSNVPSYGR
jgi:hypothetical protein